MKRFYITILFLCALAGAQAQTIDSVRIGITLSGGAARGLVHLGVLQALEEEGIHPDVVSGNSMGALIGVFYAAGYSPQEILEMFKREKLTKLSNLLHLNPIHMPGISDMAFMRNYIHKYIPHDNFDSLPTRFYCCATDLNHGRYVTVGHGDRMAEWVTASASYPRIYSPVLINGITYVDGCVLNDMPVEPLIEEGCTVKIGSFLAYDTNIVEFKRKKAIWSRADHLSNIPDVINRLPQFDYLIDSDLHGLGPTDFKHVDRLYQYGYEAAKATLEAHPELRALGHKAIKESIEQE